MILETVVNQKQTRMKSPKSLCLTYTYRDTEDGRSLFIPICKVYQK